MAQYTLYTRCEDVDPARTPVTPPPDPKPSGGLPDGGEEGQVLTMGPEGPIWAAGGGSGVTLYPTTGQSTTGGMTQKAITDELNSKASTASVTALSTEVQGKASQSDLSALQTTVGGLTSEVSALDTAVSDLDTALDGKADKSYVDTELAKKADKTTTDQIQLDVSQLSASVVGLQTSKQDVLTAGQNISIVKDAQTGVTTISATGDVSVDWTEITNKPSNLATTDDIDAKVFVAEYGVTTAQDIIAYLDSANEPFAPILIQRNGQYYTTTTAAKDGENKVIIRSFATLSGEYHMFTYTITNGSWVSSNYAFQQKLTIDSALDDTSSNPVQNQAIALAVDQLSSSILGVRTIVGTKADQSGVDKIELDVSQLSTSVVGLTARIAALETKLSGFEEFRLQMTDGTNTVDKTILAKNYVAPVPPTPPITNMFELANGVYDADGNKLGDYTSWTYADGAPDEDVYMVYWGESYAYGEYLYDVHVDRILAEYPTAKGLVFNDLATAGDNNGKFRGATAGCLDWIVLAESGSIYYGRLTIFADDLFDGVPNAIGTIYTDANTEDEYYPAPWGTTATINTTGTPLAWE